MRLARERKRQCKSMATLAQIAEMHASQISLLERGLLDVRLSTVVRLAQALDVSLCDLLDEVDRPPDAAS